MVPLPASALVRKEMGVMDGRREDFGRWCLCLIACNPAFAYLMEAESMRFLEMQSKHVAFVPALQLKPTLGCSSKLSIKAAFHGPAVVGSGPAQGQGCHRRKKAQSKHCIVAAFVTQTDHRCGRLNREGLAWGQSCHRLGIRAQRAPEVSCLSRVESSQFSLSQLPAATKSQQRTLSTKGHPYCPHRHLYLKPGLGRALTHLGDGVCVCASNHWWAVHIFSTQ